MEAEIGNIKRQIESMQERGAVQSELKDIIGDMDSAQQSGNIEHMKKVIDSAKMQIESMSNMENTEDRPMFEPVLSQLAEIFKSPESSEFTVETAEVSKDSATQENTEIQETGIKRFVSEFKNALETHKESEDNIITLMLASCLVIAGFYSVKSIGNYKKFKPVQRINGKKSMFDFGDMAYDFKNDFQHFDFSDQNFHMQMVQDNLNQQFMQQSMDFAMNEAMKAVTPFDMGGYVQGPGFNPSDTMAHNAMNDMNNMNNMGGGMF